jgi:hypothetical protein
MSLTPYFFTLKVGTGAYESLVPAYQTIRCRFSEDRGLRIYHIEKSGVAVTLKSFIREIPFSKLCRDTDYPD